MTRKGNACIERKISNGLLAKVTGLKLEGPMPLD